MDWKFEKNMYPILDTRVECKAVILNGFASVFLIRIVPEWNVKTQKKLAILVRATIRIVPEWNVKK